MNATTQNTADQLVRDYLAANPDLGPVDDEGQSTDGSPVYFLGCGAVLTVSADGTVTELDRNAEHELELDEESLTRVEQMRG